MHNTIKAVTLWLLAGYHAPVTNQHFSESIELATINANNFNTDPDHRATEAWLSIDLDKLMAAVQYLHAYWDFTFNQVGEDKFKDHKQLAKAMAVVPAHHRKVLKAIVNEISSMP